jgi:hypothetical protein
LPPLAPQVSQIGNAALVEREARQLAAGSRLRLRACRCTRGCYRGALPVPTR